MPFPQTRTKRNPESSKENFQFKKPALESCQALRSPQAVVAVEFVAVFAAVAVDEAVVVVVVVVVVVAVVVAAAAISAVFEFVETEENKMLRYRHREFRQRRFKRRTSTGSESKSLLPVDVLCSKTSLLKLPMIALNR